MRHVTLSRETGAPAMHVVDFLTRPETLPLWAFHYCSSVASDGQGHVIETTQGDNLRYAPRAFPESGVVDLLSGADEKSMQAGYVDPESLRFATRFERRMHDVAPATRAALESAVEEQARMVQREQPFLEPPNLGNLVQSLLNRPEIRDALRLDG